MSERTSSASITRRQMLRTSAAAVATAAIAPAFAHALQDAPTTAPSGAVNHRYKIGACDWMMLKRQTPGGVTRAREVGCDGVETDMGPLSKNPTFTNKFLQEDGFTELYLRTCREHNIEICSLAMSGYYAQPFAERPYEQPLKDCIATMKLLNVKVAFLPLGVSDVSERPWLYNETVERLKRIGDWAGEAGVVIGIETTIKAESQCKMLDDINSPAIKIYYNFQNPIRAGLNVPNEIKMLGKDRICQIHPTNTDVYWLQEDPAVDMPKIKAALDEIGWSGWLVIERSRRASAGRDVIGNFSANAAYLKKIFQA